MIGGLQNFPELVTDPSKFSHIRDECEKVIDARKRLPDFVFKKTFANYYVIEHALIASKPFGFLLSRLAAAFEDDYVHYMTIAPDAVDHYHRHLGFFGLASFQSGSVEERFLPVMWRDGSVDSFLARGGDVAALWGSSLEWAIAADRISWEISVIAASKNIDMTAITGFRCFDAEQVQSYVRSLYHAKDPSDSIASSFSERFLANYSI